MAKGKRMQTSRFHDLAVEKPAIIGVILAIASFLCFLPAAWHGFINIDDLPLISGNSMVIEASLLDLKRIFSRELYTPYYKPLTYISWIFERTVTGSINPHVIHFDNALLHGVNTFLVFMLSLKVTGRMWPNITGPILTAMVCALVWAFHPLRLESVMWAVERKDVLFSLFYLAGCLTYFTYATKGRKPVWLLLTVLLYLLSSLSKAMGITFLAAAVLIELLCIGTEVFKPPKLWSKIPLLLVTLLVLHLQGLLLAPEKTSGQVRVINAAKSSVFVPGPLGEAPRALQFVSIANMRLVGFAVHTVLPIKTAIIYPRELWIEKLGLAIYALFAVPLFFLALLVLKKDKRRSIGFGVLWFVATISPILLSDATGTNFLSDRYTYIPSLGLIWIIFPGLVKLFPGIVKGTYTAGHLIGSLTFIVFAVMTISNIGHWKTSLAVWENVIDRYPVNWYGYYNRAKLTSGQDPGGAIADLNSAIDYVDNQSMLYYARGTIFMEQGDREKAISDFSSALRYDQDDVQSLINRGSCYRGLKQYEAAIADYTTAISFGKFNNKALNNRGLTYLDVGRIELALQDFNAILESDPNYTSALQNRANLYVRGELGRYQDAINDYDRFLQLKPDVHEALFRRGYAKAQLGDHQGAMPDFTRSIELQPDQGFYYFGRAQSLEQMGRKQEALADLQKAQQLGVRVDPAMVTRLSN